MSDHIEKTQGSSVTLWQALTVDLVQALRFYSRLPLPALPWLRTAPLIAAGHHRIGSVPGRRARRHRNLHLARRRHQRWT